MASTADVMKLRSTLKVLQFDFDPAGDSTDPVDVSWQDMSNFDSLLVGFFRTVGTGTVDTFRIIANTKSDGSGTDRVIKTKTISSQPDALGDTIWLEITAAEVAQVGDEVGEDLRYVSAQVEFGTGTDEGVVTYIFGRPRFAQKDLTVDIVA